MKKLFGLAVVCVGLTLIGCGGGGEGEVNPSAEPEAVIDPTTSETPAEAPAETP